MGCLLAAPRPGDRTGSRLLSCPLGRSLGKALSPRVPTMVPPSVQKSPEELEVGSSPRWTLVFPHLTKRLRDAKRCRGCYLLPKATTKAPAATRNEYVTNRIICQVIPRRNNMETKHPQGAGSAAGTSPCALHRPNTLPRTRSGPPKSPSPSVLTTQMLAFTRELEPLVRGWRT